MWAKEANWQRMSLYCRCHSTASFFTTLNSCHSECFLQSFALQNEHNGTGSSISCQVPIQRHAALSHQNEKSLWLVLQLPETTLSSKCILRYQSHNQHTGRLWTDCGESMDYFPISIMNTWTHLNNKMGWWPIVIQWQCNEVIQVLYSMAAYLHRFLCCSYSHLLLLKRINKCEWLVPYYEHMQSRNRLRKCRTVISFEHILHYSMWNGLSVMKLTRQSGKH